MYYSWACIKENTLLTDRLGNDGDRFEVLSAIRVWLGDSSVATMMKQN